MVEAVVYKNVNTTDHKNLSLVSPFPSKILCNLISLRKVSLKILFLLLRTMTTYTWKVLIFFFFFWTHLQQMEVPKPGTESELQLWPKPQLQQHWIFNLLRGARELNPHPHSDLRDYSQILKPLHHSGNSKGPYLDWQFMMGLYQP